MQNLTKIGVFSIGPNDCDNFLRIVYIYIMKRHRFLLIFLLFAITSILAGYGYGPVSQETEDLDKLEYSKGVFDYYHTKRKWKNKRKGNTPFKKYLIIYLEDDLARYEDGKYLLENLEQNALLMVYKQWPKDTIEIGYIQTEDAGLRTMYDVKYEGESLVDIEGIRKSMKKEAMMLLIYSIIAGILAILSLVKYTYDRKKGTL